MKKKPAKKPVTKKAAAPVKKAAAPTKKPASAQVKKAPSAKKAKPAKKAAPAKPAKKATASAIDANKVRLMQKTIDDYKMTVGQLESEIDGLRQTKAKKSKPAAVKHPLLKDLTAPKPSAEAGAIMDAFETKPIRPQLPKPVTTAAPAMASVDELLMQDHIIGGNVPSPIPGWNVVQPY